MTGPSGLTGAAPTTTTPPSSDFQLLSSTEGRITHIALSYGSGDVLEGHKNLMRMRSNTQFTVLTESQQDKVKYEGYLKEWGVNSPEKVDVVAAGQRDYSVWPQDPFLVKTNGRGEAQLVEPGRPFNRGSQSYFTGDSRMADDYSQSLGLPLSSARLSRIQGGNVLSSGDTIFVGRDTFLPGGGKLDNPAELAQVVKKDLGNKNVVIVDETNQRGQAVFHIDMYVTATGKKDRATGRETVLVGDMKMAREIVGQMSRDQAAYYEREWGRISYRWDEKASSRNDDMGEPKHFYEGTLKQASDNPSWEQQDLEDNLDRTAHEMEERGFHVIRTPLMDTNRKKGELNPFITYNNALIENYTDSTGRARSVATIPAFGITELDHAATEAYHQAGFDEVVLVDGFVGTSTRYGVLHCAAKTIRRESFQPTNPSQLREELIFKPLSPQPSQGF